MSLNIIVKDGYRVDWRKVTQLRQDKENASREWYNRDGWKKIGRQMERSSQALEGPGTQRFGHMLSVPTWLDGKLMDNCRENCGHADWRRDKNYLKWLSKQPEQAWMRKFFGKGLDRMITECNDKLLTPAFSREEVAASDMAKLPAHYRK